MPTVFVTQETPHDFTKAEAFGEVKFLTRDDFNNIKNSLSNKALVRSLNHQLKKFDDEDWIIIAGSPYVSAAVFMILARRGFRRVKILRWDNRDFTYIPLQIEIEPELETIDDE